MKTNHVEFTAATQTEDRPATLPYLEPKDFIKAQYSSGDRMCYTGRMMDIFLDDEKPYVSAYKEFRLMTMDVMYEKYNEDRANTPEQRSSLFNEVARRLGYPQVPLKEWTKE